MRGWWMNISILYIFLASALVGFTVTDAVFHPPRQEVLPDETDKVHITYKVDEADEVDETDETNIVDKAVKPIKTKKAKKTKKVNKVVEADLVDKK